jgi:hypothetical protein
LIETPRAIHLFKKSAGKVRERGNSGLFQVIEYFVDMLYEHMQYPRRLKTFKYVDFTLQWINFIYIFQ